MESSSFAPGTVLILTRRLDMRTVMASLDLDGWEILVVRTVARARDMLTRCVPSLVLMDAEFWDAFAAPAKAAGARMVLLTGPSPEDSSGRPSLPA